MSIGITVAVPLETLAAFSSGRDRGAATEAVTKFVIESLEAITYDIRPKALDAHGKNSDGGTLTPSSTLNGDGSREPPKDISLKITF